MQDRNYRKVWLALAVSFICLAATGITVGVFAQEAPQQMLEKMKMMMENRPEAMKEAHQAVDRQKREAAAEGNYSCCLRHSCDFCALNMGQCPCGQNVAEGKPVCSECKGGWHAGDGAVPGVQPEKVRTLPRSGL